jgi:hypothetical protein
MSHLPSPFNDDFESSDDAMLSTYAEVEKCVLDLEPKVREMNRVLVPLFGKCPTSEDGSWAYLAKNDNDEFVIGFETLPVDNVLALVARLSEMMFVLEDSDSDVRLRDSYQPDLGPALLGEVARLFEVPTTHTRWVRK